MLGEMQLAFCANNFWDGKQALPLRVSQHPYALYGPCKELNSRWSSPQAAAMMNAERFNGSGSVVIEDFLGRQVVVEKPHEFYTYIPKSRSAYSRQLNKEGI